MRTLREENKTLRARCEREMLCKMATAASWSRDKVSAAKSDHAGGRRGGCENGRCCWRQIEGWSRCLARSQVESKG